MKKLLIGFYLTIFAFATAHAQVIKPVKLDSLVTVSLPAEFQKRDTLGQSIWTGTGALGYMVVIKAPNPTNQPLKKEKDLNKVFKEYTNKLLKSSGNGTILNSHDTIVNNVEVRDFALSTSDDAQGEQIRKFRILYTKEATYTFQFMYPQQREDIAKKEADQFFASIKTDPSFDGTDQYSTFGKFTGMHKALKMALIAGGVVLIIIIVMVVRRKKKVATT
ncbi:hypothetical protein [Mucilaginibacter agri]|uniref:Uncharacterized protein n=1 Tax=Mucilaginibacter agri TaxID=2695265 RepID=A0A966DT95_9SPHI|nr:hypothetical protein [Mucilaginibacter agri]NCD68484.1 hypothetical protein [Mucilaginibacter agri]